MVVRWFSAVSLAATLAGCNSDATGVRSGKGSPVGAHVVSESIVLENNDSVRRYYFLTERESSHRVDIGWGSGDLSEFPSIAPGSAVTIPLSEVMGYQPGATELWLATYTGVHFVSRFGLPGQWLAKDWTSDVIQIETP